MTKKERIKNAGKEAVLVWNKVKSTLPSSLKNKFVKVLAAEIRYNLELIEEVPDDYDYDFQVSFGNNGLYDFWLERDGSNCHLTYVYEDYGDKYFSMKASS